MRAPTDLLEQPYTFSLNEPLMPRDFIKAAELRGVTLTYDRLETLHRLRLLVPMFRVKRQTRDIRRLVANGDARARQLADAYPTMRWDLQRAQHDDRLSDPATERFQSMESRRRELAGLDFHASEYLYSPHQILGLRVVDHAQPYIRDEPGRQPHIDAHPFAQTQWLGLAAQARARAIVLSALEPLYWPTVTRRLGLSVGASFEAYARWRNRLPPTRTPRWLGLGADWFRDNGKALLMSADHIDPLAEWLDLVREASPDRWMKLRGDARLAIDLRIAAEMCLLCYEDLARAGRAKPLPAGDGRWRGEFDSRLKPTRPLDSVLTDFGLSPHPSVVLALEGDTELLIFPRVMDMFGIRRDRDFIALENLRGVDTDIGPLLAYAVAPQVESVSQDRYLELSRPLTKVLIVTDAEGRMATAAQRQERRDAWVERVRDAIPRDYRTDRVTEVLGRLVHVETWTRRGSSFEFAHFTDRQIAVAVHAVNRHPRPSSLPRIVELVADCRRRKGKLDDVARFSKVDLADELWPVLEHKIQAAEARGKAERVPIVRVLDAAIDLARNFHRGNTALEL